MLFSFQFNHFRWYESIFDAGVLVFGFCLGVALGVIFLQHHIATGYTYMNRVSKMRVLTDDDLWIAFAWRGRRFRRDWLHNYERSLRRRDVVRLIRERRAENDREATGSG